MQRVSLKIIGLSCIAAMIAMMLGLVWSYYDRSIRQPNKEAARPPTGSPFDEAKPILQALESYRSKYGKYPDELKALVPGFLASLPSPRWGVNRWEYVMDKRSENHGYALSVRMYEDDYICHVYENGKWCFDQ